MGPLDFKEAPQLNPLLKAALAAANRRHYYREVVEVDDPQTGRRVRVYLKLVYDESAPTGIEVGEDLPPDLSGATMERLHATGVTVAQEQPWSTAPLAQRRRSLAEWWHDLWS